jgi:hypothetical protein
MSHHNADVSFQKVWKMLILLEFLLKDLECIFFYIEKDISYSNKSKIEAF